MINLLKSIIPTKYWLGLGVVLLFCLAMGLSTWKANTIDEKIEEAQRQVGEAQARLDAAYEIIDKIHDAHEVALEAANSALRERVKIYEAARSRICEAEKKIGGNTDFCNQLVPDDIMRLWKEQDESSISKYPGSAANGANGGY